MGRKKAMTVHSMRRLDRWLGVPACLLLTMVRRVSEPFRSRPEGPPRRIVFVKLAEQGSTVLAHQALCQAVAKVGRTNVFFLAFEENRCIVDVMGLIPRRMSSLSGRPVCPRPSGANSVPSDA
jgi:hypothetical protein